MGIFNSKKIAVFFFMLIITLAFNSCDKDKNPVSESKSNWEKLSVPDGISYMNLVQTKNGTLLSSTGDPYDPQEKDGYIFRSSDGGKTWSSMSLNVDYAGVLVSEDSLLFCGTSSGIFMSDDDGLTWNKIGLESKVVHSIAVTTGDNGVWLCVMTPEGVYKSTNKGINWELISAQQTNSPYSIAKAVDTNIILASFDTWRGPRLYKSSDSGIQWESSNLSAGVTDIYKGKQGNIFVSGWRGEEVSGGLFVSHDTCHTWNEIYSADSSVTGMIVDEFGDIIIVCPYNANFYRLKVLRSNKSTWNVMDNSVLRLREYGAIGGMVKDNAGYVYLALNRGTIYKSNRTY